MLGFGLKKKSLRIFECICRSFPIQNKLVLDNFRGRGLGDDPKYIALELLRRDDRIQIVWLLNDMKEELPTGIKKVRYGSYMAVYHLCTARVWVDNVKNAYRTKKREGQYYIQTWHSTLGLKQNEANTDNLPVKYKLLAQKDAVITDLMYSNNDIRFNLYKTKFWYNGEVIKSDVPRVSILYHQPNNLKTKIYCRYGISQNSKLVLYAPTLRNNHDISIYEYDYSKICEVLKERFDGNFVFALRLHPGIACYSTRMKYSTNVVDATDYPDMQELLAVSDVLITDYSGSMFDFGLLRKPCFLLAKDHQQYISSDRRLQFRIEDLPFTMSTTVEELADNIMSFDHLLYSSQCESFYNSIGFHDSGNGAKAIADIICTKMK